MTHIFARKALLHKGWAENVRLEVREGKILAIATDTSPKSGDFAAGVVIPGLCNAHSHAFQRSLAGFTEERSPAGRDSFWTWRERMYELAACLDRSHDPLKHERAVIPGRVWGCGLRVEDLPE